MIELVQLLLEHASGHSLALNFACPSGCLVPMWTLSYAEILKGSWSHFLHWNPDPCSTILWFCTSLDHSNHQTAICHQMSAAILLKKFYLTVLSNRIGRNIKFCIYLGTNYTSKLVGFWPSSPQLIL